MSVRAPPAPTLERIVPPAAFVSVPPTINDELKPAPTLDRSIVPAFVNPLEKVSAALPVPPAPTTRSVAPVAFAKMPGNSAVPANVIVP